MSAMESHIPSSNWLAENGSKQLDFLFRSIVFHRSAPILIADNDRNSQEASIGASRLLGLPREKIIGRRLDDFSQPSFKRGISERWRSFLKAGEQEGTLHLVGSDGRPREVEYSAKGDVLPVRHLLVLRDKPKRTEAEEDPSKRGVPDWARDYALLLLDVDRRVAAWYAGAERIYGYKSDEVIGQHVSLLYPDGDFSEDALRDKRGENRNRAGGEVYSGSDAWQVKKDGSRFRAHVITMTLKDESGTLQGYARMVRDFSGCPEKEEKITPSRIYTKSISAHAAIAGIVSGGFGRMPEANDSFLELVGYSREDLRTGRLRWPDLTPKEYLGLDEVAQEEVLRFGACKPFEKELIRKDGVRVPVLVATAVVKPSPFEWITFVQSPMRHEENLLSTLAPTEPIEENDQEVKPNFEEIKGRSTAMEQVLRDVEVVAPTDATVLILGETGTGKELIARAIHRSSLRRNYPFITLNCAAIPTGLLESELFGYERGAFTGALAQKIGRFERANGGTLFLDEVGDIPLELQPKLLRALQEQEFERLGGTKTIPINVRLIAATNRDLTQMMADKQFRGDLYYRLKVFPITTPPLRDRPEDIPVLIRHFAAKYAAKMGRTIDIIPSDTIHALMNWHWPGNVRELENFIERSVILTKGSCLQAPLAELCGPAEETSGGSTLEEVERNHILRVFRETGGIVKTTANRLGVPRTTLNAIMKKLGISRSDLNPGWPREYRELPSQRSA